MIVKCDTCGKEFNKRNAEINRTKNNYCSLECCNNKKLEKYIRCICIQCNNEFFRTVGKIKQSYKKNLTNNIFCSNSCSAKYNNKNRKPKSNILKQKISESVKLYKNNINNGKIYCVTNLINDKKYIGQTVLTLEQRKNRHLNTKKRSYFQQALKKYGFENFHWEIIEENILDSEKLNLLEQEYITKFKTNIKDFGYNLTNGGDCLFKHGEFNINYDNTLYEFYNKNIGMIKCTKHYLYKKYNLNDSCVSLLCNEKQKKHKGWVLFKNKEYLS